MNPGHKFKFCTVLNQHAKVKVVQCVGGSIVFEQCIPQSGFRVTFPTCTISGTLQVPQQLINQTVDFHALQYLCSYIQYIPAIFSRKICTGCNFVCVCHGGGIDLEAVQAFHYAFFFFYHAMKI